MFKATADNPVKNDFVQMCNKYLDRLDIDLSFEEISNWSNYRFKKLVKQKTSPAAFSYLLEEKNKQSKISDLVYERFEIQEYLLEGNQNTEISKIIFKARGQTLDIKTQKKWKYEDLLCVGCGIEIESLAEFLTCSSCGNMKQNLSRQSNSVFGDGSVQDMVMVAKEIEKRLKISQNLIEGIT